MSILHEHPRPINLNMHYLDHLIEILVISITSNVAFALYSVFSDRIPL